MTVIHRLEKKIKAVEKRKELHERNGDRYMVSMCQCKIERLKRRKREMLQREKMKSVKVVFT